MAGCHESGRVGEVRDHLMCLWFADRRHDKARNDVDPNKAAKRKLFCVGRVSHLKIRDGRCIGMAEDSEKAVSFLAWKKYAGTWQGWFIEV